MKIIEQIKNYFTAEDKSEEKITDEALSRSLRASIIGILVCLAVLVGLTWAWYTTSVSSKTVVFRAACFDIETHITTTGEAELTSNSDVYTLDAAKEYSVAVSRTATSTANGFLKITVKQNGAEASTVYYSNTISVDQGYVFYVKGAVEISVAPMWGKIPGTVTDDYIVANTYTIDITTDADAKPTQSKNESSDDTTAAETTAAETTAADTTSAETTAAETTAAETTSAETTVAETTAAETTADTTADTTAQSPV